MCAFANPLHLSPRAVWILLFCYKQNSILKSLQYKSSYLLFWLLTYFIHLCQNKNDTEIIVSKHTTLIVLTCQNKAYWLLWSQFKVSRHSFREPEAWQSHSICTLTSCVKFSWFTPGTLQPNDDILLTCACAYAGWDGKEIEIAGC